MLPRCIALARIVIVIALGMAAPAIDARAGALFRPLTADPREPRIAWRMMSYTGDWRYGADITDSTSHGGWERDRTGLMWTIDAGHTFRTPPLRRILGLAPPWAAYQLTFPAGVFSLFDGSGSLLNTDYQFGAGLETQWNGPAPGSLAAAPGVPAARRLFDRPVVSSRLTIYHRSSHLGDEYVTLSNFGRNQDGAPNAGALFQHPPVKRMDLTYEAIAGVLSVEGATPWRDRAGVWRGYAGFEARPAFPARWQIGGLRPANFRTPAWRGGLELRSAGNGTNPHDGWVTRLVNGVLRAPVIESGWFAAGELRLAKPYDFASGDNPNGDGEVWTPRLWTDARYGHEYPAYSGSWHGTAGIVAWTRGTGAIATPIAGREWRVALEWYRGYSPDGQFLDQPLRWHPRWYVLPSLSANF